MPPEHDNEVLRLIYSQVPGVQPSCTVYLASSPDWAPSAYFTRVQRSSRAIIHRAEGSLGTRLQCISVCIRYAAAVVWGAFRLYKLSPRTLALGYYKSFAHSDTRFSDYNTHTKKHPYIHVYT